MKIIRLMFNDGHSEVYACYVKFGYHYYLGKFYIDCGINRNGYRDVVYFGIDDISSIQFI